MLRKYIPVPQVSVQWKKPALHHALTSVVPVIAILNLSATITNRVESIQRIMPVQKKYRG